MAKKVKATIETEFCSLCPLGVVTGPVWDRECEEEVYTVRCSALNGKVVHDFLAWNECAAKCTSHDNCFDIPPEECPFNII